ncbi:peroxidase family protein [Conexibacter stalactiti]|uniref:Peroxidase family protein n=1 Tax=Conexibacter stalactiti TaxID=1940611 RepID=A0ABU4HLQ1_9ACTN|nr:peroxidase family protein [Conexibacter stalactiti]MDW5594231.1 peroxidase family protein [Conexibacter stalactiti]MEC5034873.1 peroxidase family protein [Conexibacter stalactiti]
MDIARDHCLAPARVDAPIFGGRYRLLFDDLPPLTADETALHALGRPGGPCDGADVTDDADSAVAAVWPFFGQFIAHDITADRSPLVDRAATAELRNARAPKADLEGLYGAGPVGMPYLYRSDDPAKLLLAPNGSDLPRNHEGIALVGDPRNDVQLFTSQLAVAFVKLHNRLVDRLRDDGVADEQLFDAARQAATWHYQHVILREFLPGLIGAELTAELLESGPRLFRIDSDPYIPFEFADAAYRYGHAQIRNRYRVNERLGARPLFPDLMGFGPVPPEHAVDWTLQIDVAGHAPAQRSERIDGRLPAPLIALPTQVSGSEPGSDYASLATRDLQRGQAVGLASGEAIADRLGVPALSAEQVGLAQYGWDGETPLWFYILKEADALHEGEQLGPVGGRIVGEVLVGIIDADPASFRSLDPGWMPTLPARRAGAFGLADILVPPV